MRSVPTVLVLALLILAPMARAEEETVLTDIVTGEFWYAMLDDSGDPQGYCRLTIGEREGGGFSVDWELKIAFPGGSYEEGRTMAVDAEHQLLSLSYTVGEDLVAEARREGDKLVGKFRKEGELGDVEVEVPDDAGSSMAWVFVGMLPAKEGASFTRTEVNEAAGFTSEGTSTIRFVGTTISAIDGEEIHTYEMERASGNKLPLALDDQRRISRADWGGGNIMVLSEEPTKHLFKPMASAVSVMESPADRLVVAGSFPGFTAQDLYDHFTKPELLTKWWPPEAEIEMKEGGAYRLVWGDQWTLTGKVIEFTEGKRFVFSWSWANQEDPEAARRVEVLFEDAEGGAKLTLTHSPYDEDEGDQQAKDSHRQGWEMFLTKLHALRN